jgi:hypothetical protein
MAKQTINIGTRANDASGDTIRDAFDKVNDNFNEIYTEIGNPTSDLKFTGATISTDQTNQDLTLDPNGTGNISAQRPLILASFTTVQRDALTGVNGMLIYNTDNNQFEGHENGVWVSLRGDTADAS